MTSGRPPDEEDREERGLAPVDEETPLFPSNVESPHPVSVWITRRLYVSHFLSTWNSRVFEFGAVLYLARIFPGTLLLMSVYALTRGLSAILLAPVVGQYVDTGNRLQVVRVSIGELSVPHRHPLVLH
jgi:iron-regulated transporter 1